jgi:two-component system nitrogen regulation sensor histidine kinase NtrY
MKKRSIHRYIWIALAAVCALVSLLINYYNKTTTIELAKQAEELLHQKEQTAQEELDLLATELKVTKPKKLFTVYNSRIAELYKKERIALYVYENDSLVFWTDNQPAVDLYDYATKTNNLYFGNDLQPDNNRDTDTNKYLAEFIKIRNGWYEYIKLKEVPDKKQTCIALISVKPEYDFENKYINNEFSSWLELPANTELKTEFNYSNPAIKSKFGKTLFEISRSDGVYKNKTITLIAALFFLTALVAFVIFLLKYLRQRFRNRLLFISVFSACCFVLRTVMIYFKIPEVFYDTGVYDASVFANASSFYFAYMGDVLINSFLLFFFSVIIYKSNIKIHYALPVKLTLYFLIAAGLLYFSYQIRILIFSLVNNSTISYNINELFNFSGYSLIALTSVGMMMFAFYLLVEKSMIIAIQDIAARKKLLLAFFAAFVLFILFFIHGTLSVWEYVWPAPLIIISYCLRKYKASYNFINLGLIILVSTFIVAGLFSKYELSNKKQTYTALSLSLTDRQDVIAENEFIKISQSVKNDPKIKNLLSLLPLSSEQLEQSIRQINFSGYFERYEVILSLFKNDCSPVFKTNDITYENEEYFKQQIEHDGFQTICDELYFIDKDKKPIRYIAKIPIEDLNKNPDKAYHLYVQLEPKLATNLGTFPDLLLDKSLESKLESKQLSYAVYGSNKLLTSFGEYQYPLFTDKNNSFMDAKDEYEHYVYSSKKEDTIIISDKKFAIWQQFTSNSYLFIFFSTLVLCVVSFNSIILKRNVRFNSLNNRIQFIFVSVVVLSLAGVVCGTVWVVTNQFETKNTKELIAKSQSVLKELQQTVGQQDALVFSQKDYTSYTLKKLAQLFGSDISLFNRRGMLFSTSQPAIYEQGLLSKFMNPDAYSSFKSETIANYSHRETIGKLNYLSAYIPFYNKNDKLIGYINLPYFSRQKDLEKELTAYLTTLISIYTILFAITTLVALLVSNLLTKPLRIIKQQISNIKFGAHNEALKWKSNDEIGNLVTEYNNMLVKLEQSSELLAKSERESAWREMAKQVAHEIKNPLTPMKLNIQHLQRVVETNPDDINERVNKVSQMLIEQIDTLSHIATEFSNFAKLPNATLEIVNVFDVLQNVTNLFKQNTACDITLNGQDPLPIKADKEQCLRIFTNLLKNAEQSVPENRKGKITIEAFTRDASVVIHIKDNGVGIPDAIKPKLFTPNFTTKSTGTGLGLAMVKNSVVSFNGTIGFETEENKGTVFTVIFPLVS